MIKHSSGMAVCLKFVSKKVSSFAPLVYRRSNVSSSSLSQPPYCSEASPFRQKGVGNNGSSLSVLPVDLRDSTDSLMARRQTLTFNSHSDVIRYLSYVIFDRGERHAGQSCSQRVPCYCTDTNTVMQYSSVSDYFHSLCDLKSYHCPRSESFGDSFFNYSEVGLLKSSQVEKSSVLKYQKSADKPDALKPPSKEQLVFVSNQLAKDLPAFFANPKFNINMYHANIVLEDNIRGKRFSGLNDYYLQTKLLYILGHLRFSYINLDVIRISIHPEDGSVKVRWKISVFRLRRFWKIKLFSVASSIQAAKEPWIEGFSIYYVMGDGLVHKHIVDKMIPHPHQELKKLEPSRAVPAANPLACSNRNKV